MYQVLLIDDEPMALDAVQRLIDWNELEVSHVLTAQTVEYARKILKNFKIDLVISDIEMPQMNGLELVKWIKEEYPDTAVMMLSCHSEFEFAQKAIRAGSADYILKPVKADVLRAGVKRALDQIERQRRVEDNSRKWERSLNIRKDVFFKRLIGGGYSEDLNLFAEAERMGIRLNPSVKYRPLMILVQKTKNEYENETACRLEYNISNTAQKLLVRSDEGGVSVVLKSKQVLVILKDDGTGLDDLQRRAINVIEDCNEYHGCDVAVCIGESGTLTSLKENSSKLQSLVDHSVISDNAVFVLEHQRASDTEIDWSPYFSQWQKLFQRNEISIVEDRIDSILKGFEEDRVFRVEDLRLLRREVLRLVTDFLQKNSIQVDMLYADAVFLKLTERSLYSVGQFLDWMHYTMRRTEEGLTSTVKEDSLIQKVREYVTLHINEDLNREKIASAVFLSPDYLSKIFKKKTGKGLNEFVIENRVEIAKQLLSQTDLSVGIISTELGYSSFSHFTKVFREYVGTTPSQYRQVLRNKRK